MLTELIEKYQDYAARTPKKGNNKDAKDGANGVPLAQQTVRGTWGRSDTVRSEWIFETVRSMKDAKLANGGGGGGTSYRSLAQMHFANGGNNVMPPGMIPDDDASYYDEAVGEDVDGEGAEGAVVVGEDEVGEVEEEEEDRKVSMLDKGRTLAAVAVAGKTERSPAAASAVVVHMEHNLVAAGEVALRPKRLPF